MARGKLNPKSVLALAPKAMELLVEERSRQELADLLGVSMPQAFRTLTYLTEHHVPLVMRKYNPGRPGSKVTWQLGETPGYERISLGKLVKAGVLSEAQARIFACQI